MTDTTERAGVDNAGVRAGTMPPETLAALDASIAKWDRIAESGDECTSLGPGACPLCRLFYEDDCHGCPVRRATGGRFCEGTPYGAADYEQELICDDDSPDPTAFRAAAREEALFLRAIRPIGVTLPTPEPYHD